ncbi:MAG TPA: DUF1772 domain-containing protein [Rhizomicrobium sp.]|jgi:hypothetical protein|nr:DUF1772 domain-containing protein [Rhizomicrobium sp.]
MTTLRWTNLALAVLAVLAPMAHVLEMPNKLALADGALWLAIQQHLYRGWGPIIGGPVEIGALVSSLALILPRYHDPRARGLNALAAACYAGMVGAFFIFNAPVNEALNQWTAASLPPDWPAYRRWWETGHAIAAVFAVAALAATLRAAFAASPRAG